MEWWINYQPILPSQSVRNLKWKKFGHMDFFLFSKSCRGGSLLEILKYLPDGGHFSRVPMWFQIQGKFQFQVHVRHMNETFWNGTIPFFFIYLFILKTTTCKGVPSLNIDTLGGACMLLRKEGFFPCLQKVIENTKWVPSLNIEYFTVPQKIAWFSVWGERGGCHSDFCCKLDE